MGTFLLTFFIILLAFGGLAIGVCFGRQPIKGSCGGLNCTKRVDCTACKAKDNP